jgi:hypothetical protein
MNRRLLLSTFVFILTGIAQSLQAYELYKIGLSRHTSNAIAASGNVVGVVMLLVWSPNMWLHMNFIAAKRVFSLSVIEITAQFLAQYAISTIGSGQFTVINSFIVVLIALLNRCVYRKALSRTRFLAVLVISVFVCVSGWGQYNGASETVPIFFTLLILLP